MHMNRYKYEIYALAGRVYKLVFSAALMSIIGMSIVQAADLNVCAGQNEMPFSNQKQEGFENAIAKLLAAALNRPLHFVFWKDARYVVRDYLNTKKCDLVLGADANDPRMLKTEPYYKSGYVFITRKDSGIDIVSWNDKLLKQHNFRIGVLPDGPGKTMLLQINRFDDMFDYFAELQNYMSTRNRYIRVPPERLVHDVESQYIQAAMLWAPEAARYVHAAKVPLRMQMIKDDAKLADGKHIAMQYDVVMGVRQNDTALKDALNAVIKAKKSEIKFILQKEGIPLLVSHNQKEGM